MFFSSSESQEPAVPVLLAAGTYNAMLFVIRSSFQMPQYHHLYRFYIALEPGADKNNGKHYFKLG